MRSPSPGPMLPPHRPMNTPSPVHTRSPPLPLPQTGRAGLVNRSAISPSNPAFGRKSTAYSTTTDSDESSSEESSGEDVGLRRGGTVTQRGPSDSKQISSASPSPVAPVISSKSPNPPSRVPQRPNPSPVTRRTLRTNDSETDSSDDEPLAALVPPRRPASSASGASSRSGGRPRPLLEINEITSRPPMVGRKTSDNDDAFTQGRTLLSTKPVVSRSPPVRSPLTPVTSSEPPAPFVSPPPSPVKSSHAPLKDAPLPPPPNESFQRMSPMRRSTAETTPSSSPVSEKPRDALAERLHRMVIQDAVRSSSPESLSSASSSPRVKDVAAGNPGQHGIGRAEIKRESTGTITPANHLRRKSSSGVPITSPAAAQGSDLDADLINLLGGGIRLISKEGEDVDVPAPTLDTIAAPIAQPAPARATRAFGVAAGKRRVIADEDSDEDTSSSESDDDDDKDSDSDARRPVPIPIARRTPPPAFRVTSRPHAQEQSQIAQRPRSSTLHETPSPIVLDSPGKPNMPLPRKQQTANGGPVRVRPRSTSLNPSTAMLSSAPPVAFPPRKPFASSSRTESPASSTGDSSSGIAPLTPQDGSDVSSGIAPATGRSSQGWGSGVSGLGMGPAKGKHKKSRSVSFESDIQDRNELQQNTQTDDLRRNERRRNEAKAAIEVRLQCKR
ncbi:hypothetical protein K523DRAFT_117788 [Schizophyllum commune Tattone D]|nr:hypothetical protein K523DRAFT_117788 [Schizophyllum commune Tattone D]